MITDKKKWHYLALKNKRMFDGTKLMVQVYLDYLQSVS